MEEPSETLAVLGVDIAFKSGADMSRARSAAGMVEERYAAQKERTRGMRSKDILLTYLALGLADEILRMKAREDETQSRLRGLLAKIEKSL